MSKDTPSIYSDNDYPYVEPERDKEKIKLCHRVGEDMSRQLVRNLDDMIIKACVPQFSKKEE